MRLLGGETGYRNKEALFYLTDYTDVHGSNSVKIPVCRQAETLKVFAKAQRNSLFTEYCHAEERGISDFDRYEMLRLSFTIF